MQPLRKKLNHNAEFKSIFVRNDVVNKISNLSNIDIVNVLFSFAGRNGVGREMSVPATITEQAKILQTKLMVS